MNHVELLSRIVAALEVERIQYMLTGSLASSIYGEPRSTNDVDFVIDPSPQALDRLVRRLQEERLCVDLDVAREALRDRGQFNALLLDAKVDFIIRKAGVYPTLAFERRQRVRDRDMDADVVSPEDLILTKLASAVETGSEGQLRDVSGMVALIDDLDRTYIELWAPRLGVLDAWKRLVTSEELA